MGDGLLRVLSMGFLAEEDSAIMWRGLKLNRAVQHFVEDVHWGDLDYLLIDMPPGTGDIQMGLARKLPRAEVIVVTTPPIAAQKVAARTADMARKGYLRVAGVIENMSDFTCEHGTSYALFGSGGGERLAADIGVPLIGTIPLDPAVAAGGDRGEPAALQHGRAGGRGLRSDRHRGHDDHRPRRAMEGCSARMLDRVESAVRRGGGARPHLTARPPGGRAEAPPAADVSASARCSVRAGERARCRGAARSPVAPGGGHPSANASPEAARAAASS